MFVIFDKQSDSVLFSYCCKKTKSIFIRLLLSVWTPAHSMDHTDQSEIMGYVHGKFVGSLLLWLPLSWLRRERTWATHMHTLQPHILDGLLRSHSTCPCVGHKRPSHCTVPQSAWHSSCSSRTRPGQRSPPGNSEVSPDTYRATGRTAASQP